MRRALLTLLAVALCAPAALADDRVQTAIVGGDDASQEYPFFAELIITGPGFGFGVCAGSLIAPTRVLTAAHCVAGEDPNDLAVGFGNLGIESPRGVDVIAVHPRYSRQTDKRDAAVLTLKTAVVDREPISLGTFEVVPVGTLARVIGRGFTDEDGEGGFPELLQEVDVPVRSDKACDKRLGRLFYSKPMLCAGRDAGGEDSCKGDSGGPLFTTGAPFIQIGITSSGRGCGRKRLPGIYTELAAPTVRRFVESQLGG